MSGFMGRMGRRVAAPVIAVMALVVSLLVAAPSAGAQDQLLFAANLNRIFDIGVIPGDTASQTMLFGTYSPVPITITDVTISDPANAFTVDASGCRGVEVYPLVYCGTLYFSPPAAGIYDAALTVTSSDGVQTFPYTAKSADPFWAATADSADFGSVRLDSGPSQVDIGVLNLGNLSGEVPVVMAGPDADEFTVPAAVTLGDPGSSVTLTVGFTPSRFGRASATLTWPGGYTSTLSAYVIPGPLDATLAVTSVSVSSKGVVTLRGTATANRFSDGDMLGGWVGGSLTQTNRRFTASAQLQPIELVFNGVVVQWTATVSSSTGIAFVPGKATVELNGYVSDYWYEVWPTLNVVVQARGTR